MTWLAQFVDFNIDRDQERGWQRAVISGRACATERREHDRGFVEAAEKQKPALFPRARRSSARACGCSPSGAVAMPRSGSAGGSSRSATRLSAPSASPAARAREAAAMRECTPIGHRSVGGWRQLCWGGSGFDPFAGIASAHSRALRHSKTGIARCWERSVQLRRIGQKHAGFDISRP